MAHSQLVSSVLRALDILRLVAETPSGLGLSELTKEAGLKKTTTYNLARTLSARGFLDRDASGRYVVGSAVQELARLQHNHSAFVVAGKCMRKCSRKLPLATITFSELTPNAALCRLRMSPDRPGELQRPLDRVFPPYRGATAICLQATALNSALYERNFPFSEHGCGAWPAHSSFLEQKANVQRHGWYALEGSGKISIAFAIPDNFALGFSQESPAAAFKEQAEELARELRVQMERSAATHESPG